MHGTGTESGIKKVVDKWYEENILDTEYEDLLSIEAGFCGDRTRSTSSSSLNNLGGTETTATYYGAYIRLITNKTPTFECSDEDYDLYTVDESSRGNHALDYPVGLITADEVAYAGGVVGSNNTNSSYYLYTNQTYWTMSPLEFVNGYAFVFIVNNHGSLGNSSVNPTFGVRPVLNIRGDITISGSGTSTDPYVVS